ncbi:hypothetical protein DM02DRAFT_640075 [Periconia macrospinosa]|uniref:Helicase ATP-binding domain-containing protein n=1 Tax=Periconia macrospinosa TaxID=97972 RepID=A0A2V1E0Y2_9PLEO|nr:hypothetical protein DM02DRAFT_640075 [Periconia macrospinosa]
MYRRYISDKTAVRAFVQADKEEDSDNEEDEAADLQTRHSSHVGGLIYGRHISEAVFSTESKRAAFRRIVREQAAFRSVQKPALQAIMRQESPVVAIMGTAAGKSILFMLPASVSTGVTVVIVPLVSLRGNMKERCHQLGITCVEWSSRRPSEWAQVVLVTPESAVGKAFGQFINRQRAMGRLDQIVVDECHVILDSLQG